MTKKITLAPQDAIREFGSLVDEFLEKALGHPEALITDESTIGDFISPFDLVKRAARRKTILDNIQNHFQVDASACVYLLDVLRLIRARRASNPDSTSHTPRHSA